MIVTLTAGAPVSTVNAILAAATAAGYEARAVRRRSWRDRRRRRRLRPRRRARPASAPSSRSTARTCSPAAKVVPMPRRSSSSAASVSVAGVRSSSPVPASSKGGKSCSRRHGRRRTPGADMLRGGAYKPRTSPYAFQGLGEDGLRYLAEAREATGLPVVTEVMEPDQVESRLALRRHAPDRRPQHGQLPAAAPRRPGRQAGAAQARVLGDDRGMADERRVHPGAGQRQRRPLRARHPRLRHRHPLHARSDRRAAGERAVAPADHRRSQPWHRPPLAGRAAWPSLDSPPVPTGSSSRPTPIRTRRMCDGQQTITPAELRDDRRFRPRAVRRAAGRLDTAAGARGRRSLRSGVGKASMADWAFHIVDVFTDRPLAGNQLAVFEDAADIPEALLQPLAQRDRLCGDRLRLSAGGGADARMRIFTPTSEVPFAGHPMLGTAVVVGAATGQRSRRPGDRPGTRAGAHRASAGSPPRHDGAANSNRLRLYDSRRAS